jgi:hypothetical protein
MSNPVMNYNQFMAAFKKAEAGYHGKANVAAHDAKGTAKVKQELATGPVKGKGTAHLSKATNSYLGTVKKKDVVKLKK